MGRKSIRLAAAALAVLLAACHAAVVPISWSGTAGRSLRLVPSRLTLPAGPVALSALRGGAPSTQGIPLVEAMPTSTEDGKVTLKLSLNYGVDGGSIVVVGPSTSFGSGDINRAPKLHRKGGERWEGTVEVPISEGIVKYQYVVLSKTHRYEARIAERSINLLGTKSGETIDVQDSFRSPKPATLSTSCFSKAVFGKGHPASAVETQNPIVEHEKLSWAPDSGAAGSGDITVRFALFAPRVEAGHSVWVQKGSDKIRMASLGNGIYYGQVAVPSSGMPLEYKYVIQDAAGGEACAEKGMRKVTVEGGARFVVKDEAFNYELPTYKAAGMAIPVSGIKTRQSTGIGEFMDLKLVADWCEKSGLQLIQILPINDSGEDPSPYSASSSFALHPIYVRPITVCEYYTKKYGLDLSGSEGWAKSLVDKLNGNWKIDYGRILDEKRKLMDAIFDAVGRDKILEDADFVKYIKDNEKWLMPYAAFKVQLAKERTFNNQWFDCTKWSRRIDDAAVITSPQGGDYDHVVRVYFTQYHLHCQLIEASRYLESKGVALKGDLPIGVTRCSQDVWAEPHNFKLDRNAGAPGDPEQNWGFPPYNWDQMHRDGCAWWRRRLKHMEQYFHAYRIDHVLGFFRMWEIPRNGGGGQYVPNGGLRESGLRNLRAIQTASNMMICGEDLGNVPPEVGPVLLELGILGLKIQRWCDGKTWDYGYLTVAASSCHDCSPCRLWWNENWGEAERFYNSFCGQGQAPGGPPDWISQKIIKMHAESSAMWTINPMQDYLDMWNPLRSQNAKNDMINKPGSTEGCWIWRCHKRFEDLMNEDGFNTFLKNLLRGAKRGVTY